MDDIALVTGASRGIGYGCATKLIELGYKVIGTATTESKALALKDKLPGIFEVKVLNLLNRNSVNLLYESLPNISILINNAGITRDSIALRMKEQDIDDVINVNLINTFLLTKKILRGMLKSKFGRIVNITSIIGHIGNPGQANYAASKAGLTAFTKSIAAEYGSKNITANCVAPGFIVTDMSSGISDEQKQKILNNIPVARFGKVEDIANAVTFLCSKQSSYITGTTLHVNGGMSML